jgi:hypothetical protein
MIFGNTKPPPLTAFCTKLSVPANLLKLADSMTTGPSSIDKRAVVLCLVIMAAAGHFIGGLQWDRQKGMSEGSRRYLRDTNLDVITAEAIVWIHFLMGRFWKADGEKDPKMFEQVGYVTLYTALQLALDMIEKQTGFDFKARSIESRKFYLNAMSDSGPSYEAFATVVFRSLGCRSLAEPLKTAGPPPLNLEWTRLATQVDIFFSTMPSARVACGSASAHGRRSRSGGDVRLGSPAKVCVRTPASQPLRQRNDCRFQSSSPRSTRP